MVNKDDLVGLHCLVLGKIAVIYESPFAICSFCGCGKVSKNEKYIKFTHRLNTETIDFLITISMINTALFYVWMAVEISLY